MAQTLTGINSALFVMISYNKHHRIHPCQLNHLMPLPILRWREVRPESLYSPLLKVSEDIIIAKVVPVAIEVGDIELGHEPCKTGYYPVSNLF